MEKYENEIRELHRFFQDYSLGLVSRTEVTRFADALDKQFVLVSSSGNIVKRIDSIDYIKEGYGKRKDCKIWIENVVLQQKIDDILIVTYEEWQTIDAVTTSRTSTVVFKEDRSKRNDLAWMHVHESGLKEVEQDS